MTPRVKKIKIVVPLGLEPRLFWTKTKRVASYTMGQKRSANLIEFLKTKQNFITLFHFYLGNLGTSH